MQWGPSAEPDVGVVVPVKAFSVGKRRLAPSLDPATRSTLARAMATTVVRAAAPLPVVVVCDADEVRSWAHDIGAEVLWTPGVGLNGAVEAGVAHLGTRGAARAIVTHADLPLARTLAWVGDAEGVTLVPDRHGDGTNVICVPTGAGFGFSYGAGSCVRHRETARRLGLATRVVPDVQLGWDVDVPADLDLPADLEVPAEIVDLLHDHRTRTASGSGR